jgi:Ca2+-transporting ATPase
MPVNVHSGPEGLTETEAAGRLHSDGPNELTPQRRRTAWHIGLEVAREPMFQLLVAAGLIYLLLGDLGEAAMLLAFVAVTIAITITQEQRTEHALEALRDLTSPRALVLRDGQARRIPGREVVRGDLLVLTEGDRVAADALVLSANDLMADESLLTGEAVPVGKLAATAGANGGIAPRPGASAAQGFVYAGTMLVGGQGLARVLATGAASEVGRIGKALGTIDSPPTPLHIQTRRLVRVFSVIGLALSVVVVLLYGLTRGDWLAGLLAGITLAMSLLPQEFLLILTVFMAMGAWRMSRQQVLTRRAATIEALGSATVLCTDKTGTLTQNRMAIAELAVPQAHGLARWTSAAPHLPQAFHELVEYGILASEREPFDPMDKAFLALGDEHLPTAYRHAAWTLVHEYGLGADLLAMTHVWQAPGSDRHAVAVKGAPEAVAALCHLSIERSLALTAAAEAIAARGLRVLAVARASYVGNNWPATPHGFDFVFIGLVALADPLRPSVPAAVQECRAAGIRVVMITGDHPATACTIAAQAGLETSGSVLTGADLMTLSDAELRQRVASITVFARVMPEQKLRIVEAFKASGQVVAMTGDGVNDAPSLKAAHIGIAMGSRGTDVAREASSLVLLDDDFSSIVQAVRLGRRIYDNLRKAMAFILAVHVPIAGLSLLPLLLGLPLVFMPVHIAFLELLIDPVCSVVFEAETEESDVMKRPPRDPATALFSFGLLASSVLQGTVVLLAVGAFFVGLLAARVPEAEARAAAFAALVVCNVALIVVNRSLSGSVVAGVRRPNPALWWMLGATSALLAAALYIAPLRALFRFAPVAPPILAGAFAIGVVVMVVLAVSKRVRPLR